MKILILGHHRSGSTSLYNAFHQSINNCEGVFEPFRGNNKRGYIKFHNKKIKNNSSNLVVKSLITDPFLNEYENITFYKKYIKSFNKVIILLRKDTKSTAESLNHIFPFLQNQNYDQIHKPYKYNPLQSIESEYFAVTLDHRILNTISKITKLPILYYEDIFSGNLSYLENMLKVYDIKVNNFKLFCEILNPENRYRQN